MKKTILRMRLGVVGCDSERERESERERGEREGGERQREIEREGHSERERDIESIQGERGRQTDEPMMCITHTIPTIWRRIPTNLRPFH